MALPKPDSKTTVVVTGASSGIGAELARELARRGYGVTLVARRRDRLEELAQEIGDRATVVPADLASRDGRADFLAQLDLRTVVGLCNNAGYGNAGRFTKTDLDKEQAMIELNCGALHHLMLAFLPGFVSAGAGAVLNVASLAGVQPFPSMATYGATKAFVSSISEAVHTELKGTGVSVTALYPGPVHTEFDAVAGVKGTLGPEFVHVDADEVAKQAVEAMASGRRSVVPSLKWKVAAFSGRVTPRSLLLPAMRRAF